MTEGYRLADLQAEAHDIAVSKGWYETERTFGDFIALIHSELSEALEAHRKEMGDVAIGEELADVMIRLMDFAESLGVDLETEVIRKMAVNRERPHRHGGRKV